MKINKKLEALLTYYGATRQAGHTTLLKEGTNHYDKPFLVLTHCMAHGMELNLAAKDIISYQNLDKLIGQNRPLAIDNAVMTELLSDALMKIESLEEENKKLLKRNQTILVTSDSKLWKKVDELEKQIDRLNKEGKTPFIGKFRH